MRVASTPSTTTLTVFRVHTEEKEEGDGSDGRRREEEAEKKEAGLAETKRAEGAARDPAARRRVSVLAADVCRGPGGLRGYECVVVCARPARGPPRVARAPTLACDTSRHRRVSMRVNCSGQATRAVDATR